MFDLPDEEASILGEAAMIQSRRGGWISPSDDLLIAVAPHTNITLEISGEFANLADAKPQAILDKSSKPRQALSGSNRGIQPW
ncbi:hypothetical protein [Microbacterium foliorum]|uniref:hypothetical protein n=1 Tax=Microbacterium foliorum TaxID=104336 RepID=UPI00099F5855|nr:hypothetical protein [Microbacterium foliorum]AQY01612.1 hypothetical protein B2G67_09130 [Microbacterium foliorum]